jgi:hypothetical protein
MLIGYVTNVEKHLNDQYIHQIKEDEHVYFLTGKGTKFRVSITGERISISSDEQIVIEPKAANSILIDARSF